MAKKRTRYVCQTCGYETPRWMGRCPNCESWHSLVEEAGQSPVKTRVAPRPARNATGNRPQPLDQVEMGAEMRLVTGVAEFDRVTGGGIMMGSLILIAGAPGIGKSTLMTELGKFLPEHRVLYITGEESVKQVKHRAQRLGVRGDNVLLYAETNVEAIIEAAQNAEPDLIVVDSIQTVFRPDIESAPGSVSQVRESAAALLNLSKDLDVPTFLVGHITKQGAIAGPRVLEHMVDTVLYFEGDRHHTYRILRAVKNRFGSANELGVFEMTEIGLREVANPSEMFLSERTYGASGSTVVCSMEGTRPVLVEIQALVTPASYGTPQRTATGFDTRRLQMLLAVLEKRLGMKMSSQDVFVNVAGGLRLDEPAVDLGVVVAVASSYRDIPADSKTILVGEIGLGGEVRTVSHLLPRLREGARMGFERIIIPQNNARGLQVNEPIKIAGGRLLRDVLDQVL